MSILFKKIFGYCKAIKNITFIFFIKVIYGKNIVLNNVYLGSHFEFDISAKKFSIQFGENIRFKKYSIVSVRNGAKVQVGDNVFFNCNISINCRYVIAIGNDCMFGENVKIYDHNHIFTNKEMLVSEQGYSCDAVKIGNNCWVGSNVTILKGVEIGDNVVIGANCLIYKNVPANTIVTASNILEYKNK